MLRCGGRWLKRPFGQTPVAVTDGFFFGRDFVFRIFLRVLGAFVVGGVAAQPELHLRVAPTAEEVVKPAAARIATRQMAGIAQAALPEFGVKFAVAQMVGVQDVETLERQVVEEFPENRREGFVGDFGGRQERDIFGDELLRGWRPVFRFCGAEVFFERGVWLEWRRVIGR